MKIADLIKKLQELPGSTVVVLENPNTGACSPLKGFEHGRFNQNGKEFTVSESVEENNSIVLL